MHIGVLMARSTAALAQPSLPLRQQEPAANCCLEEIVGRSLWALVSGKSWRCFSLRPYSTMKGGQLAKGNLNGFRGVQNPTPAPDLNLLSAAE